jgi:hypothetical protein
MTIKFYRRLLALLSIGAVTAPLVGCQTTNLAARTSHTQIAQGKQCERMQNRRGECEDQVGCSWDFDASVCVAD